MRHIKASRQDHGTHEMNIKKLAGFISCELLVYLILMN